MREIKFRIWNEDFKKYLEPMQYPNGHSDLWIEALTGEFKLLEGSYEYDSGTSINETTLDNCIIEQYTGLNNPDSTNIYEGDLLDDGDFGLMEVFWSEGSFLVKHIGENGYMAGDDLCYYTDRPVVSNIHKETK